MDEDDQWQWAWVDRYSRSDEDVKNRERGTNPMARLALVLLDTHSWPEQDRKHKEMQDDLQGFQEQERVPMECVAKPNPDFGTSFTKTHSCELCENIACFIGSKQNLKLCELLGRAEYCKLYQLILSSVEHHGKFEEIQIFMEGLDPAIKIPRLFAKLDPSNALISDKNIPILPEAGSEYHLLLLDQWLRECDNNHSHHKSDIADLPTRVLDVGNHSKGPGFVRICVTNGHTKGRYIALSHRWTDGTKFTRTTAQNIGKRCQEIELENLPRTFRDAVHVARKLGVQFLWIDSLCILQGNEEDWKSESKLMESVYASAYCTIAATSGLDSLLCRLGDNFHRLKSASSLASASAVREDFEEAVRGELNTRGWVLQERCLSRRIIHFDAAQTYWECESAIRCETVREDVSPWSSLSNSNFPERDSSAHSVRNVFAAYSSLDLTYPTDKPIAILGLEYRLAMSRGTWSESVYGILRENFGEYLLWKRSGEKWMQPIFHFEKELLLWWTVDGKEHAKVPSWSWMAYNANETQREKQEERQQMRQGITYMIIPDGDFTKDHDLKFKFDLQRRCVLAAPLKTISEGCHIEHPNNERYHNGWDCKIEDKRSNSIGWASYDCSPDINTRECISIGQGKAGWQGPLTGADYDYVLLVGPVSSEGRDVEGLYRRLGIAAIPVGYLADSDKGVQVF